MLPPPLTYAFQPQEKTKDGFVRMLEEFSARGGVLTRLSGEPTGELIHEGRLLIKRTRALLWFARPALGLAAYTRVRTRLRRAAGLLADQRDLSVARATLEKLARKASLNARDRTALAQVFRDLVRHSAASQASEKELRQMLKKAMDCLSRAVDEIQRNAAVGTAWPSPCERIRKAFRANRKAGKRARRTGKDADFHEWRKKAKRLLYQLELTQAEQDRRLARAQKWIWKLQDKLGSYHDGAVVEERLRQALPLSASARRVLRLLEKRKTLLRKKACKIAANLEGQPLA